MKYFQKYIDYVGVPIGDFTGKKLEDKNASMIYRNQIGIRILKSFMHGINEARAIEGKFFGEDMPVPDEIVALVEHALNNQTDNKIVSDAVHKLNVLSLPRKTINEFGQLINIDKIIKVWKN